MDKRRKVTDYYSLNRVISLILCIIPLSCWVLGILTRIRERNIIGVILRIFFTLPIIWILDIIFMIFTGRIFRYYMLFFK